MGDMSRGSLIQDLRTTLMDSAERFKPADYDRQLDAAVLDLPRIRPRVISAELTLVADQADYTAPADLIRPLQLEWGMDELSTGLPWQTTYPGRLPRLGLVIVSDVRSLRLYPAPTATQISLLGASAAYRYSASYTLAEAAADTTVQVYDRHLLLLRALVEAMQDLANRSISKPITLGVKAGVAVPRNGYPADLAQNLLAQWERMAQ